MIFFGKKFGKKNNDLNKNSKSLLEQISSSMNLLLLKSGNLNQQFEEEKLLLQKISDDSKKIVPVNEILGAKFEQEILVSLTKTSFACDNVLAGSNSKQLKKTLLNLESLVRERLALQTENQQ